MDKRLVIFLFVLTILAGYLITPLWGLRGKGLSEWFITLLGTVPAFVILAVFIGICLRALALGRKNKPTTPQSFYTMKTEAKEGDAEAQYNLGLAYFKGKGVTKDITKAIECWRKAAEQDFSWAHYMLGKIYSEGKDVERNDVEAYWWLSLWLAQNRQKVVQEAGLDDPKLVEADLESGRQDLERIVHRMTPEQITEGKRRVADFDSQWSSKYGRYGANISPFYFWLAIVSLAFAIPASIPCSSFLDRHERIKYLLTRYGDSSKITWILISGVLFIVGMILRKIFSLNKSKGSG